MLINVNGINQMYYVYIGMCEIFPRFGARVVRKVHIYTVDKMH